MIINLAVEKHQISNGYFGDSIKGDTHHHHGKLYHFRHFCHLGSILIGNHFNQTLDNFSIFAFTIFALLIFAHFIKIQFLHCRGIETNLGVMRLPTGIHHCRGIETNPGVIRPTQGYSPL